MLLFARLSQRWNQPAGLWLLATLRFRLSLRGKIFLGLPNPLADLSGKRRNLCSKMSSFAAGWKPLLLFPGGLLGVVAVLISCLLIVFAIVVLL